MNYISTRGGSVSVPSAVAIKQGLAPDGGLYLPETIPALSSDSLRSLLSMDYPHRAAEILSLFLTDFTKEELLADCAAAYGEKFSLVSPIQKSSAAPLLQLTERLSVLELWHGPTCAFKDMALQLTPRLLSRALQKTHETRTALILVATSGDTGKAALDGFCDIPQTAIQVYYPENGVSAAQKRQMITQEGSNVDVIAIHGHFDDAQNGVKRIFANPETAKTLDAQNCFLSSANSINWGRLVPQIAYYVSAYCDLATAGRIQIGEKVNFTVPTGNFGNILAAFIAKQMGLPIGRLICASNTNHVLTDFLTTGIYDRNRPFHVTLSPSMDILISSNLERLLYLIAGSEKTKKWMESLASAGRYELDSVTHREIAANFIGDYASEEACLDRIASVWQRMGYLIDPHTAVAMTAAERYLADPGDNAPMIVVSTASPYKFTPAVARALGLSHIGTQSDTDELTYFRSISEYTHTAPPAPLTEVYRKPIRFSRTVASDQMTDSVITFANSLNSKKHP